MPANVFAPPKADLERPAPRADDKYYVVSAVKFHALAILTFNLYFIYWFYNNYSLVRARTGERLWPAARGLFSVFFAHNLCARVSDDLAASDKPHPWHPLLTATLYVVGSVLAVFLGLAQVGPVIGAITDIATVVVLPVILFPLQRAINVVSNDPQGASNQVFGAANWIWLVLGGLLWAVYLLDVLLLMLPTDFPTA